MDCCRKAIIIVICAVGVFCYLLYGPFALALSEMAIHFIDNNNQPCKFFCGEYITPDEESQLCCNTATVQSCVTYQYCEDSREQLRDNFLQWGETGLIVTIVGGIVIGLVLLCLAHVMLIRNSYRYEQCWESLTGRCPCPRFRRSRNVTDGDANLAAPLVINQEDEHRNSFTSTDTTCSICHQEMVRDSCKTLRCGHGFHKECIDQWFSRRLASQRVCPNCRLPYRTFLF